MEMVALKLEDDLKKLTFNKNHSMYTNSPLGKNLRRLGNQQNI
jgi:hypothetical protein